MSYDFYMSAPVGPEGELVSLSDYMDLNCTYNVSPMFRAALANANGVNALHGMAGKDALPLLLAAVSSMEADPQTYRDMNPPNGWGSYEGALKVLRSLAEWCQEVPGAVIRIS